MSKYTTEVRYICETESGLGESKGYNDVNDIIELARPKIFNFSYPIYDTNYKSVLETKILKHFYTREIGFETVGLWKLKLDTKLNEIMPYYNQLYKSALLEFNPLWTEDYTEEHKKKTDGESINVGTTENVKENDLQHSKSNTESQSNITNSISGESTEDDNTRRDKYADTPQGALTDLEDDKYLTNARKITESNLTTTANTSSSTTDNININQSIENDTGNTKDIGSSTNNNLFNNTEDYLASVQGRRGRDVSDLLMNYRKTFLNIDMQVIDELEELFMHLW